MRIAIVYDCLFPHTVGGAERWYRELAERLEGPHEVTYLTRRQWEGNDPGTPFRVVPVSRGGPLYTKSGRRSTMPPLRFGLGVFWHLLRHASRYDAVHCASFPYFSLLGAWLALRLRRRGPLVVDWFELWTREYWISYLGPVGGRIGHLVQRLCARTPDRSFSFSRLHAARLEAEGHRAPLTVLTGMYGGESATAAADAAQPPVGVFAGRHIPEKRVPLLPDVLAAARRELPDLRCVAYGDGPEREALVLRVAELGLAGAFEIPGRVSPERIDRALREAACNILPSQREGYGMVVVESAARGVPSIVVAGPDNAATELIEPGVNGFVATSADPAEIARCVIEAVRGGAELRRSTLDWYRAHASELSIKSSLGDVLAAYGDIARS
jgi:glycosyltransferase involved in cell wall biosynthesis